MRLGNSWETTRKKTNFWPCPNPVDLWSDPVLENNFRFLPPLLRWCLKQDMTVSNVTQVIEYEYSGCFSYFGERVSDGDQDTRKAIIAETF